MSAEWHEASDFAGVFAGQVLRVPVFHKASFDVHQSFFKTVGSFDLQTRMHLIYGSESWDSSCSLGVLRHCLLTDYKLLVPSVKAATHSYHKFAGVFSVQTCF
jgi:hypothetical protein